MRATQPTSFDDLYVISDLHMGGRPGGQIFKQASRLGAVLAKLAAEGSDREIAFVLNGDVIDSLAENLPAYVAMNRAEIDQMLDDVFANFKAAWNGLAAFACTPHRHVVITLGNHDLEVAMDYVQKRITARLADGDPRREPSISFRTDGEGFDCMVGASQVHCTHGNEYDAWNQVDYEQLRKLAGYIENRDVFPRRSWKPNAGTRLVVDVMNQIKDRYAFVDLLKPETKPVLAVLLTLNPNLLKVVGVGDAVAIGYSYVKGELRRRGLLLGDDDGDERILDHRKSAEVAKTEIFGPRVCAALERDRNRNVHDLLLSLEREVRAGERATARVDAESADETLGFVQMLVDRIRKVDKVESLRAALLDWAGDDEEAFDLRYEDDVCKGIKRDPTKKQDFLIAGHTHLERALPIDGQGYYYNSGTWIRLLRLPRWLLDRRSEFERVYQTLDRGDMNALDALTIEGPDKQPRSAILDRAAMVHVCKEGDHTVGRMYRVSGNDEQVEWNLIPRTEFSK